MWTQVIFEFAFLCFEEKRCGSVGLGLDTCCPLGTGLWFLCLSEM